MRCSSPTASPHATTPVIWRFSALERDSGKQRWAVDLPGEPLMDGLLITAQGRTIVPLRMAGDPGLRKLILISRVTRFGLGQPPPSA